MLPIFLALAFIAVFFIVVIAGQPDEFKVSRSLKISVSPETVFPHVNDLHAWKPWSPWVPMDPNAKSTFSGPDSGVGAAMRWEGNNKVGVGSMTITDSQPCSRICFRLDFEKPMAATNTAEWTFLPLGTDTQVTWSMSGKNTLVGKIFGLFINCERMVGCQFEKGLANLKSVVQG